MKKLVLLFLVLLIASCQSVQEQKIAEKESTATAVLNKELDWAARQGDVEKVKALIASGADVETRIDHQHTPLMFAVYIGHYEMAEILIEAGADVNAAHAPDHTVLYHALESALESRQLRAEINATVEASGRTALAYAVEMSKVEMVKQLIEAGADLETTDIDTCCPTRAKIAGFRQISNLL